MTYTGYRKFREVLELVVQQIEQVGLENELNFVLVGLLSLEWCTTISISSAVNQKIKDKTKQTFIRLILEVGRKGLVKASLFEQSMSDMNFIRFFLVGHHPGKEVRACDSQKLSIIY